MTIITILLGLAGLGVVVFFHELGHFLMARAVGVEVEEFSLGWGPKLAGFKRGSTTYRLSVLPIGGYCRMKGEDSYRKAIEEKLEDFPLEPGSYFAAHPLKRILIALGGPAFNVAFAFIVFTLIWAIGFKVESWGTKVALASDYDGQSYAADQAGLETGDSIVSIGSKAIRSFADIQEAVSLSAGKPMAVTVDRSGTRMDIDVVPVLDRDTGAGRLGIYPWIDLTVDMVVPGGPASLAGIKAGDRIVAIEARELFHAIDLVRYLETERPERPVLRYVRDDELLEARLVLAYPDAAAPELGIGWKRTELSMRSAGIAAALADGWAETAKTISGTFKGLATLFKGVNVLKAVSGPARITWTVGQVATESFSGGLASGLSVSFNFLAILSIGLFVMNLLPIPLLDGGWIVLFVLEAIRNKRAKVKTVFRYQTIGVIIVACIFLMATFGDILFFSGR